MHILLVEDNIEVCDSLSFHLKQEGFRVDTSYNGLEGLGLALEAHYDLILLDRILPDLDGLTILKKLRKNEITIPVILITALGELEDKIDGLDTGADDYMIKPFEFKELLARIRCINRRPRNMITVPHLSFGKLRLDNIQRILFNNEFSCALTNKETQLLEVFLKKPETNIPRQFILNAVWGNDTPVENGNIDNYIFLLRRKLRAVKSNLVIKTIHGIGYRLEEGDA